MKYTALVLVLVVLSIINVHGAGTSPKPLPTPKDSIGFDGLVAWVKNWMGVLSQEVNTARMKDENLTAEVGALKAQVAGIKREILQVHIATKQQHGIECGGTYTTYKADKKTYFFGYPKSGRSQAEAKICCQAMGRQLVAVNSPAEFQFIQSTINNMSKPYDGYWNDATCSFFGCLWYNSPTSVYYLPPTKPNKRSLTFGPSKCVAMLSGGAVKNALLGCTEKNHGQMGFVCE